MTLQERSDLILAFARVLYVNGQATEQTVAAAEELGRSLGLTANIIPRWGELELQGEDNGRSLFASVKANPTGVDMDRVASTMRAVKDRGWDGQTQQCRRLPKSRERRHRRQRFSRLHRPQAQWRWR
jgi:hypothetical protein